MQPTDPQPKQPARRRFVEFLLGGGLLASAVSFLYPVLRYIIPPKLAELGSNLVLAGHVGDLRPNSGKIFRFGNRPGILILTSDNKYYALSAVCTHLGCTVQYRPDLAEVWCPCHNGKYTVTGANISGPPPRPLEKFDVILKGNDIYAQRTRNS
ncbi:MAG TPA: Rieske 2Fe-2S domain-containing protein [Candidatus Acidoferrum sp.]|nr:Rieske 2Fe-2S domain-containing protein [Candidatus Acidoferrum sp.]